MHPCFMSPLPAEFICCGAGNKYTIKGETYSMDDPNWKDNCEEKPHQLAMGVNHRCMAVLSVACWLALFFIPVHACRSKPRDIHNHNLIAREYNGIHLFPPTTIVAEDEPVELFW